MSDIFDKVAEDRDPLKKLLSKIPGFKGYVERGDRRLLISYCVKLSQ